MAVFVQPGDQLVSRSSRGPLLSPIQFQRPGGSEGCETEVFRGRPAVSQTHAAGSEASESPGEREKVQTQPVSLLW